MITKVKDLGKTQILDFCFCDNMNVALKGILCFAHVLRF